MSSTLNWASSGNGTQVSGTAGTAVGFLTDLQTLVNSFSANAAFNWQVAGSNLSATPYYVVLSRKDGSPGRIAYIILTTAFTSINPTLWEQLPAVNNVFCAYFPQGTGSTLSNLNATSGTICGNDTSAPYASSIGTVSGTYPTGNVQYYMDSYDVFLLQIQNPVGAANQFTIGGGEIVEDASGTTYPSTVGTANAGWSTFASPFPYQPPSGKILAGALPNSVQVNYSGVKKQFYCPYAASTNWVQVLHSSSDAILADDANSKAWFAPVPLLSATKGEGAVLKLRQVGWGPGQASAFFTYNTTGPVVQARQFCNLTVGSSNSAWLTNFKI